MLRCAAPLVIAAYVQVHLIPQDLRALPAELFTQPLFSVHFSTFCEFIFIGLTIIFQTLLNKNFLAAVSSESAASNGGNGIFR